jgi:hypothetical protein
MHNFLQYSIANPRLKVGQDVFLVSWYPIPLVLQCAVFQHESLIRKWLRAVELDTTELWRRWKISETFLLGMLLLEPFTACLQFSQWSLWLSDTSSAPSLTYPTLRRWDSNLLTFLGTVEFLFLFRSCSLIVTNATLVLLHNLTKVGIYASLWTTIHIFPLRYLWI